jgi:hypothetical protein
VSPRRSARIVLCLAVTIAAILAPQLVFVLDLGADKPGTQGTIWIDDVDVY